MEYVTIETRIKDSMERNRQKVIAHLKKNNMNFVPVRQTSRFVKGGMLYVTWLVAPGKEDRPLYPCSVLVVAETEQVFVTHGEGKIKGEKSLWKIIKAKFRNQGKSLPKKLSIVHEGL